MIAAVTTLPAAILAAVTAPLLIVLVTTLPLAIACCVTTPEPNCVFAETDDNKAVPSSKTDPAMFNPVLLIVATVVPPVSYTHLRAHET